MTTSADAFNISDELAAALDATDTIRQEANAGTFGPFHAHEQPGRVYGDAKAQLQTLLRAAFGPTDAQAVYDYMIETGETWQEGIAYVTTRTDEGY